MIVKITNPALEMKAQRLIFKTNSAIPESTYRSTDR